MGRGGVLAWSRPWAEFAGLAHHLRLQLAFQLPLLQPFRSFHAFFRLSSLPPGSGSSEPPTRSTPRLPRAPAGARALAEEAGASTSPATAAAMAVEKAAPAATANAGAAAAAGRTVLVTGGAGYIGSHAVLLAGVLAC